MVLGHGSRGSGLEPAAGLCIIRIRCSHVLLPGIFAAGSAELKWSDIVVPADDGMEGQEWMMWRF